ncbi:MAG: Fic family protein [Candidatus Woesearchaeota archaeon]|jgi:Fic family protein|nr:Fic family protein [Candidatus Woesearchaeota archaeon]
MYIEKKKIGKNEYNYLKISVRLKNKIKTKTIAYLGKVPMNKQEIKDKIDRIPKSKIKEIEQELKKDIDINKEFLNKVQLKKLEQLKKDFNKKLKVQDKKIINDMFKDFKTFYIYNTNAIEGNTITLEETNLLLNENKTPEGRDLREIYDHINEKEAFDFIIQTRPKINNDLIIKLHSMLLNKIDKRIGNYRTHNVRVFGAAFNTSPAELVKIDVSLLLKWYNKNKKNLHPLILSAVFHEKFERIHPFYDGNGRTGRMLVNLILINNKFPPLIIENKKRKEYYNVLSIGHKADLNKVDTNFYKPIIEFFYNQIIHTYDKIFIKWG